MSPSDQENLEFTDQVFDALGSDAVQFSGRRFEDCTFRNCSFAEASLRRGLFIGCTFSSCDLSNAHLTGATMSQVHFVDSKLIGINWTSAAHVSQLICQKSNLNYSTFAGRDMRKVAITDCIAREVDFSDANLSEANCRGTDFAGTTFSNTNLTKADLRGARGYAIAPAENKIKGAKFSLPEAIALLHALGVEVE